MGTKLTINLRDGILEVEGNDEFVRAIYEDFKSEVSKRKYIEAERDKQMEIVPLSSQDTELPLPEARPRKLRAKRENRSADIRKPRSGKYKPTFDPNLDVRALPEFYDSLHAENVAEQILIFVIFLKERLKMEVCTADHIFTCFYTVRNRTKIPTAFAQAFYNAQARTHFIQVPSLQEISVTILGGNHFEVIKKRIKPE